MSLVDYLLNPTFANDVQSATQAYLLGKKKPTYEEELAASKGSWNWPSITIGQNRLQGPTTPDAPKTPDVTVQPIPTPTPSTGGWLSTPAPGSYRLPELTIPQTQPVNIPTPPVQLPSGSVGTPSIPVPNIGLPSGSVGLPSVNLGNPSLADIYKMFPALNLPSVAPLPDMTVGGPLGSVEFPPFQMPKYTPPGIIGEITKPITDILSHPIALIGKVALDTINNYKKVSDYWDEFKLKNQSLERMIGPDALKEMRNSLQNQIDAEASKWMKDNNTRSLVGSPYESLAFSKGAENPWVFEQFYKDKLDFIKSKQKQGVKAF